MEKDLFDATFWRQYKIFTTSTFSTDIYICFFISALHNKDDDMKILNIDFLRNWNPSIKHCFWKQIAIWVRLSQFSYNETALMLWLRIKKLKQILITDFSRLTF